MFRIRITQAINIATRLSGRDMASIYIIILLVVVLLSSGSVDGS